MFFIVHANILKNRDIGMNRNSLYGLFKPTSWGQGHWLCVFFMYQDHLLIQVLTEDASLVELVVSAFVLLCAQEHEQEQLHVLPPRTESAASVLSSVTRFKNVIPFTSFPTAIVFNRCTNCPRDSKVYHCR
jgi:hypothetical protein